MFSIPKKDSIKGSAIDVVSATGGYMLSDGIVNLIPQKARTENEDLVRAGLAIIAGGGAAAVKGRKDVQRALRSAFIGMSISQIAKLVRKHLAKTADTPTEDSTTVKKFVGGVMGLACSCGTAKSTASPVVRMPRIQTLNAGVDFPSFSEREKAKNLVTAFD